MEHAEHILIVDDDFEILYLLTQYLTANGFPNISTAIDGETARDIMGREDISLLILDIMLPGEDGFSIAKSIREENSTIPILMLSARTTTQDRIYGLKIGADDYLTKPFDLAELLARIHAILRRASTDICIKRSVRFGKVILRMPDRVIEREGKPSLPLSGAELKLLSLFLSQPNQLLTREVISSSIGIKANPKSRIIDVRISRLRNRIGDHTASIIQTVRNKGYMLPANIEYLD